MRLYPVAGSTQYGSAMPTSPAITNDDYGVAFTLALLYVAFEERFRESPQAARDLGALRIVRAPVGLVRVPARGFGPGGSA